MKGGPQKHFDIIDNMFKFGIKQGLKRAIRGPETHILEKSIGKGL